MRYFWQATIAPFMTIALLSALSGCQSMQTKPSSLNSVEQQQYLKKVSHWKAKGKISFKNADNRHNASFSWAQKKDTFAIHLHGPLGQGSTWLKKSDTGVRLEASDGRVKEAPTAEDLMHSTLGWRVPISNLQQWIKGLPAEAIEIQALTVDELGFTSAFSQQGWKVSYPKKQRVEGWLLPKKVVISQGSMKLIIIIKHWTL